MRRTKQLRFLILILIVVLLLAVITQLPTLLQTPLRNMRSQSAREASNGSFTRPDDFPSFLQVPPNVDKVRYREPDNANIMEGCYALNYLVDETYPPDKTIQFIHQELSKAGFVRLKYSVLQPLMEISWDWYKNERRVPGYTDYNLTEYWANNKYEYIHVGLTYQYQTGHEVLDHLEVWLLYCTAESENSKYVKRYLEYHPEEFESTQGDQ